MNLKPTNASLSLSLSFFVRRTISTCAHKSWQTWIVVLYDGETEGQCADITQATTEPCFLAELKDCQRIKNCVASKWCKKYKFVNKWNKKVTSQWHVTRTLGPFKFCFFRK
jgi:hypothetical protein